MDHNYDNHCRNSGHYSETNSKDESNVFCFVAKSATFKLDGAQFNNCVSFKFSYVLCASNILNLHEFDLNHLKTFLESFQIMCQICGSLIHF